MYAATKHYAVLRMREDIYDFVGRQKKLCQSYLIIYLTLLVMWGAIMTTEYVYRILCKINIT
jgi:hypothetical protein